MSEENSTDEFLLRIRRIEEVLTYLRGKPLPDLNIDYDDLIRDVEGLVKSRLKLNAVKLYSDRTGCTLIEAKRRIDSINV